MEPAPIDDPRAEIDAIDSEMLRLLNRRAEIALRVGAAKAGSDRSLCDAGRERQILDRLRTENSGPLDGHSIENIFQRIIDESLLLQQRAFHRGHTGEDAAPSADIAAFGRRRVAFLGDRGTFSEEAVLRSFGNECETVSLPTFEELFDAIETGRADLVLAPLENSLIGSVHRCVDLLADSSLHMIAEVLLPVSHFLVACPEATMETIRTVESHPAALAQCRRFFAAYPHLEAVPANDTAGAVRRAVESGDVTRAAIGSRRAAEIYGGKVLREHLEDNADNHTRFVLLASEPPGESAGPKISVVIRLQNRPGALHDVLRPFVRRGIDLAKIESIPIRNTPGEFNFYIEINAPAIEGDLVGALAEVEEQTVSVRILGRYSTIDLGYQAASTI